MKILLINSNRYHYPPVIPVGLEYLCAHLEKSGHIPYVLDLCFSNDPGKDLENKIIEVNPDITGITIRQIDTVLYHNNEFFIDEIKKYVSICSKMNLKVILGGSGFSIMPGEIMKYTGADYGISGPGELALTRLLDDLENNKAPEKLINGHDLHSAGRFEFLRSKVFDYSKYLDNQGIIGFRTQIGCTENCFFCTESGSPVIYHDPASVGREIGRLKEMGYSNYHLCDSEFNMNLDHCISVCKAITKYAGVISWTLYMKPEPFSAELFRWLKKSGAALITLSIDTKTSGQDSFPQLAEFFRIADYEQIKVAVDLSVGYPNEKLQRLKTMVDFLDNQTVETIGINSCYRIYPGTYIHKLIEKDKSLEQYVINPSKNKDFLHPVFFKFFTVDQLTELTEGRKKFRVEGFDKSTNYQRVN